ncbi:hypothetical protein [Glutamicibacter mishrai]|uniref:hypothetical protein n=1 Tax=Glutamicibacter mishrai TaxID=1775880 RepID=UPI003F79DA99
MVTFQCDSGDSCHRINVTHKTLQVVEQPWQDVVEQFYVSQFSHLLPRNSSRLPRGNHLLARQGLACHLKKENSHDPREESAWIVAEKR